MLPQGMNVPLGQTEKTLAELRKRLSDPNSGRARALSRHIRSSPFFSPAKLEENSGMSCWGRRLCPMLDKYSGSMGKAILEVAPGLEPLATPSKYPGAAITYWEKDPFAINVLRIAYQNEASLVCCDLENIGYAQMEKITSKKHRRVGRGRATFDTVLVSNLLNYLDYRRLLWLVGQFLEKGGLLFLNNTINLGDAGLFSKKRPRSSEEITETLRMLGMEMLDKEAKESGFEGSPALENLLLVAQKQ